MRCSRRTFLVACGATALPVPAIAAQRQVPLQVGELWGMPYAARGALGNPA